MSAERQVIVVGLTGAFGSGCTTAAKHLRDERGFEMLKLSDCLRKEWKKLHPDKEPTRTDLQRLGDDLREAKGGGYLVDLTLEPFWNQYRDQLEPQRLVIDGIRNVHEIKRLQDVYGYRFVLIAVLSSVEDRWGRIGSSAYVDQGMGRSDFIADDQRDANEDTLFGQQVQLCMDKADILLDNSTTVTLPAFHEKMLGFVDLASGNKVRPAHQEEILMNIAYSASNSSKCIRRHVGAVVVDIAGQVVGVGYNENPIGTKACIEEPDYDFQCYRDIVRNDHFKYLSKQEVLCHKCGRSFSEIVGPPWKCPNCQTKGENTNLEKLFFPDRALNWCTAIHAEVWALLAAGERCRKGTVYTTAFPCFQCSEKIIQVGVAEVLYTESYPDAYSRRRLELAGITLRQFEGVRSSSFERIFSKMRPD
jgi:deoxycytidylate deaminase/dephospho-CoA kinase